jgi:hypothetical protein
MKRFRFLVFLLLSAAPVFAHPTHHKKQAPPPADGPVTQGLCCDGPVVVPAASSIVAFTVVVDEGMQNPRIEGNFSAAGGSGHDIIVIISDPISLQNAITGHPVPVLYRSAKLSAGVLDVDLPGPGSWALAFVNNFSLFSPKAVTADVALTYTEAK